jgi:hypothetical protein
LMDVFARVNQEQALEFGKQRLSAMIVEEQVGGRKTA